MDRDTIAGFDAAISKESHLRAEAKRSSATNRAGSALRGTLALAIVAVATLVFVAPAAAAGPPEHAELPALSHPGLASVCGTATDSAGNLYLSDNTAKTISVFGPTGSPITSFSVASDLASGPCQMAVDSSGGLYVNSQNRREVLKYKPEGAGFPPTGATTYARDTAINGNGALLAGPTTNGAASSVAVDPTTQDVYVTSLSGNEIQEFAKPTENYTLKVENPVTHAIVETAGLTEASDAAAIQAALRNALCSGGTCVTVADATSRWKATFNGTATTPVTAKTNMAPIEVVKAGGNKTAFQMFNGSAAVHITSFTSAGALISNTIGDAIAGATYIGADVYGKNGNVYVADKAHNKVIVFNHAGNTALAEFNGSDSPTGAFDFSLSGSLPDLSVDQANGHVYVSDMAAHGVVNEFDGAGNFVSALSHTPSFEETLGNAIAVDNGATSPNKGTIYLTAFTAGGTQKGVFAFGPLIYGFPLKVAKTGLGSGTITSTPAGISCGASCEAEFEADSTVTLIPAAGIGSKLGAWSGCDAVIGDECEVTMDEVREVSARFDSRPVVSEEAASQITASSARLDAKVNPKGKATSYRFEYITEAAWLANGESFSGAQPATKIPAAPVAIGNGLSAVAVGVKVESLAPSTTYRFRVTASSEVGTAEGERNPSDEEIERSFTTYSPPQVFSGDCPGNESLRSGASANLPDCRAWEQASPVDKNGSSIQGTTLSARTAEDGSTIGFESAAGIPGGSGAQNFPTYLAKRGEGGWATTGLLPDASSGQQAKVLGWTPDFATIFDQAELLGQGTSLLARSVPGGAQSEIVPHTLPTSKYRYLGASGDGDTVIFEAGPAESADTTLQLTPDAAPGKPNLYAWSREEPDEVHLVGILPDGSTPSGGSQVGRGEGDYNYDTRLVGEDGSVSFSDREDGQLYLRLNPTAEETEDTDTDGNCIPDPVLACTVHVSATQKENGKGPDGVDSAGPQPASFMAASTDGSVVTFTSSEKLTDDANTGPEPDAPAIARAKASDGSQKNLEFIPAFANEIAIDEAEGYVYWTDPAHGRIGRAKLDGTDFTEGYISGLSEPLGIAVIDEPGKEYIFWTRSAPGEAGEEAGTEAEFEITGEGTIGRADLDGTNVDESCLQGLTNPRSIDASPTNIYWTIPGRTGGERFNGLGDVGRAGLDCNQGSVNPQLIDNRASGDIAVNASHIYYSFWEPAFGDGYVHRFNLDGTEDGSPVIVAIAGAESPPGLALDSSHLYWTNPTTRKIGHSDLDGTNGSEEHNFITEAGRAEDLGIDDEYLYWTANQEVVPNPGTDLYQLDRDSGELTDLAPDSTHTNGVEVLGVLGASEDGSYVYFAANGVPDGVGNSPNEAGESAAAGNCDGTGSGAKGTCNLYVAHGNEVDFIARLSAEKAGSTRDTGDGVNWIASHLDVDRTESGKVARVSPDGQALVFRSQRQLTEYDNQGPRCVEGLVPGSRVPGPCLEFYRFDYAEMDLSCLTCDPRGTTPEGAAMLATIRPPGTGASFPEATLSRNLSSDGNRFFFETPDALVAADTNGQSGCPPWGSGDQKAASRACQDVYEWEAAGTGSCEEDSPAYSTQNEGCIYLISTGKSKEATFFADADLDGENAFIFTYERLVGQDEDDLLDVYDAREGGGLASQHEIAPVPCEGEACKGLTSTPPTTNSAGSASFQGSGNQAQQRKTAKQRCPKGKRKVRRNGKARCVKPKHHKRSQQRAAKTNRGAGR